MGKSCKQVLFEIQKRIAEEKGETFPYSTYEEMNAGFALRLIIRNLTRIFSLS